MKTLHIPSPCTRRVSIRTALESLFLITRSGAGDGGGGLESNPVFSLVRYPANLLVVVVPFSSATNKLFLQKMPL